MLIRVLFKLQCFALSILLGLPLSATAHEFWLEPIDFNVEQGGNIRAHIKVGEGLDGDTYAFFPANFERFELTTPLGTGPLKKRFAQKPAVDQTAETNGLHVLTYQSKPSKLRYKKREIFEKFLRSEGIEWVLEAHEKRGLPELAFTELYKRFAKTLIQVGDGSGQDRQMGMPFEWVVLTNPYIKGEKQSVTAQLFFKQSPFADSAVNVFIKRGDEITQEKLKTNSEGKIELSVEQGGLFLINAVHMVDPNSSDAAWMSLWASTTFSVN